MTKEQMRQKYWQYWESTCDSLDAFGGERMRVISGNTSQFTVGFMCDYFGYNFCVITASHICLAKIEDFKCKGVLKYA